jgi:hypothetical protein
MDSQKHEPLVKAVEVLLPKKSIVQGKFHLWHEDPNNRKFARITLQFSDREFSSSNISCFYALKNIRRELEREGILLKCYGASRNVWPSGMSTSMRRGEMAYKLFLGKKGDIKDLVSIFDSDSDVDPCNFEEQKKFNGEWLVSIGIDPDKETYPWKNLFLQQPVKTLKLFLRKKLRKS